MVTTLEAYGFDSYPFVHLADQLCLPYPQLMAVVEELRQRRPDPFNKAPVSVSMRDIEAIIGAYAGELRRQEQAKCSRA